MQIFRRKRRDEVRREHDQKAKAVGEVRGDQAGSEVAGSEVGSEVGGGVGGGIEEARRE